MARNLAHYHTYLSHVRHIRRSTPCGLKMISIRMGNVTSVVCRCIVLGVTIIRVLGISSHVINLNRIVIVIGIASCTAFLLLDLILLYSRH